MRQTVIAALGVHPIGSSWIVDYAGHKRLAPEYLVNLLLPNGTTVPDIKVSVCEEPGYDEDADAWDVLVGMNVITMGAFSLTSDEHGSMFSFCIPHDGHLDYAHRFAERNNLILKRAGRNGRAVMVDPESGERRDLKIKEAVALRKQGWVIAEISESTKKQQRSSRN